MQRTGPRSMRVVEGCGGPASAGPPYLQRFVALLHYRNTPLLDAARLYHPDSGLTGLAPVPLHPVPASGTLYPMAHDPLGRRSRSQYVVSLNPDVSVAVPPPVTGIPEISRTRPRAGRFGDDDRGSSSDIGNALGTRRHGQAACA